MALLSLEPWDAVWRRNQHVTAALVQSGAVAAVDFFEPARLQFSAPSVREPYPSVNARQVALHRPKRLGGLAGAGRRLRRGPLREADVLWVNDPALGVHCTVPDRPLIYDVTDDWRTYPFPARIKRRIIRAEDVLARTARIVVCSVELQRRWQDRYGVEAAVVHNGIDAPAWQSVTPHVYEGERPHVGYVGTVQAERLDVPLILRIAADKAVGTLHLIGPDALGDASRSALVEHPKVRLHGSIPANEVPRWTRGLDVLISPHVVSAFTLSLDAIKSYEYLASGRPIVATPTSGFQILGERDGVHVVSAQQFIDAVHAALRGPLPVVDGGEFDWSLRAQQFAAEIFASMGNRPASPAGEGPVTPEGR